MFIKLDDVNYFVIPDGKSVQEIFNEIFGRMNRKSITEMEKRKIISEIRKQVKKG